MGKNTRIFTDVDYEKDGKQTGWLYLPYSVTRSAYGNVSIPIAVVKNGKGPTVFLMAGNHGDEYEGQIGLCRLIQTLTPEQVSGRVIAMPAANLPAALAGARVSPLDDGNLNRAFPGDPDGSPTYAIAHYIDSVLFPMTQFYNDFHSGGSSLDYIPFVSMRKSDRPDLDGKAMAALKAFGAPIGVVWAHTLDTGFANGAAIARGIVTLGGEFGGGGSVSVSGIRIVERGIRNFLRYAGCLAGDSTGTDDQTPMRLMEVKNRFYFVLAPDGGLFEPTVELGDWVREGQLCGQVYFVDNPMREPVPAHFRTSGMVICKRRFGRVERGDCVAHLATDLKG